MITKLLVKPRLTDKSYLLATKGIFTFTAPIAANRNQIKDAIEATYGVEVINLTVLVQTGKMKNYYRNKRSRFGVRQIADIKKVYATLKAGQSIPAFTQGSQDEANQEEQK